MVFVVVPPSVMFPFLVVPSRELTVHCTATDAMEDPKVISHNITVHGAIIGKVLPNNNSVEVIDLTCEEVKNEVN